MRSVKFFLSRDNKDFCFAARLSRRNNKIIIILCRKIKKVKTFFFFWQNSWKYLLSGEDVRTKFVKGEVNLFENMKQDYLNFAICPEQSCYLLQFRHPLSLKEWRFDMKGSASSLIYNSNNMSSNSVLNMQPKIGSRR